MFLIREAGTKDFKGVYALAERLDSYNLPADRPYIRKLLAVSQRSFRGGCAKSEAKYLFVLEERRLGGAKIVGCSLIIAQHGTPRHPHLWFALDRLTHRSRTLRVQRTHRVLRLGSTPNGPTEIGGLIVLPSHRGSVHRCGLQLAYIRFVYMAMHPERFKPEVLIEYRGAMGQGKRSPFWEAIGRVFTRLSYAEADRLSVTNKEFIRALLPAVPVYCALLPREVQAAIGAVHPAARRAVRLSERIGFKPLPQVEPFDGGPYYSARRRRIRVVRGTRRLRIVSTSQVDAAHLRNGKGPLWLIGTEEGGGFRGVMAPGRFLQGRLAVEKNVLDALRLKNGSSGYAYRL